jgi:hypothetical protein
LQVTLALGPIGEGSRGNGRHHERDGADRLRDGGLGRVPARLLPLRGLTAGGLQTLQLTLGPGIGALGAVLALPNAGEKGNLGFGVSDLL